MSEHPDHQSRGHAEFSPSSLKYVAACPAYEGKDGTSVAAERGTRIHEALEVRDPSALHDEEELAIYEQIVEMESAFMSNFGTVQDELNEIQVEIKLNDCETWGTCDRFLILEGGKRAVMADYKTGISIIDPPESNWQAKAYTIGAFQMHPEIEEITFVFYVPLHTASLHHTFKRADLDSLIAELSKVIKDGERIRPKWGEGTPQLEECTPSQYCRFCKHEDHCPALGGLVVEVAKKVDVDCVSSDLDITDNSPANLAKLYNIAKIVENWAVKIKKVAMDAAKEGVELDGLRLRSMGKTKSVTDNKTLIALAEEMGISAEDVLEVANISLSKVAKLASANVGRGEKRHAEDNFVDACEQAGIIHLSDERFTLTDR